MSVYVLRNTLSLSPDDLLGANTFTPTIPNSPQARTYTVRPNDSLSKIAQSFYGNSQKWPMLAQFNGILHRPHFITVGQKLLIPFEPGSQLPKFNSFLRNLSLAPAVERIAAPPIKINLSQLPKDALKIQHPKLGEMNYIFKGEITLLNIHQNFDTQNFKANKERLKRQSKHDCLTFFLKNILAEFTFKKQSEFRYTIGHKDKIFQEVFSKVAQVVDTDRGPNLKLSFAGIKIQAEYKGHIIKGEFDLDYIRPLTGADIALDFKKMRMPGFIPISHKHEFFTIYSKAYSPIPNVFLQAKISLEGRLQVSLDSPINISTRSSESFSLNESNQRIVQSLSAKLISENNGIGGKLTIERTKGNLAKIDISGQVKMGSAGTIDLSKDKISYTDSAGNKTELSPDGISYKSSGIKVSGTPMQIKITKDIDPVEFTHNNQKVKIDGDLVIEISKYQTEPRNFGVIYHNYRHTHKVPSVSTIERINSYIHNFQLPPYEWVKKVAVAILITAALVVALVILAPAIAAIGAALSAVAATLVSTLGTGLGLTATGASAALVIFFVSGKQVLLGAFENEI